jgi:hypothetical protein
MTLEPQHTQIYKLDSQGRFIKMTLEPWLKEHKIGIPFHYCKYSRDWVSWYDKQYKLNDDGFLDVIIRERAKVVQNNSIYYLYSFSYQMDCLAPKETIWCIYKIVDPILLIKKRDFDVGFYFY